MSKKKKIAAGVAAAGAAGYLGRKFAMARGVTKGLQALGKGMKGARGVGRAAVRPLG